jgi:predicted dienelactone hydrolase
MLIARRVPRFLYFTTSCLLSPTMSFSTQRTSDGTITISPKRAQEQSALVVISHGLGDTAEGFADVAEVSFAKKS